MCASDWYTSLALSTSSSFLTTTLRYRTFCLQSPQIPITVIILLHLASPRQKVADHSSRYTWVRPICPWRKLVAFLKAAAIACKGGALDKSIQAQRATLRGRLFSPQVVRVLT